MFPNKFLILWNGEAVGIEVGGYPFTTKQPGQATYWLTRQAAEDYRHLFVASPDYTFYEGSRVVEIQFVMVS
jgi:hypothetical protein